MFFIPLSLQAIMIKFMVYIEQVCRNLRYRCKGRWLKLYLLLHGCEVGKGLKCLKYPSFRLVPNKNIFLGNNITIGENITLEIVEGAVLKMGNQVNLTRSITIAANIKVEIGNNCLIAENVSIRDTNHKTEKHQLILKQASETEPICIGEDVWIGANSVVLKGANIPNGVVIGANSLVLKKSVLQSYGIYGGNPLKLIKLRD